MIKMTLLLCLFSCSLFAQGNTQEVNRSAHLVSEITEAHTHQDYDLSLAFVNKKIRPKDLPNHEENRTNANGVEFGGGMIFGLGEDFDTVSRLVVGLQTVTLRNDLYGSSGNSSNIREAGIEQDLNYIQKLSKTSLRYSLGVGATFGQYRSSFKSSYSSYESSTKVNFMKYSISAQLKYLFSSGVAPFAKYRFSLGKFNGKGKWENSFSEGSFVVRERSRAFYGNEIILGLSCLF